MQIQGLDNDYYLMNNDIIVTVQHLRAEPLYVSVQNITGQIGTLLILQPNHGGRVVFNLSPTLKTLFSNPKANNNYSTRTVSLDNMNLFQFSFWQNDPQTLQRAFTFKKHIIRGGSLDFLANSHLTKGQILSPISVIPYWEGYPIAEYSVNFYRDIYNIYITKEPNKNRFKSPIEKQKANNCEGLYVKFLNSLGGYSYWLFDSVQTKVMAKGTEVINNFSNKKSLGQTATTEQTATAKVHKKHLPILQDLIFSSDVYYLAKHQSTQVRELHNFQKIYVKDNEITYNNYQNIIEVTVTFSSFTNFNPTLLW